MSECQHSHQSDVPHEPECLLWFCMDCGAALFPTIEELIERSSLGTPEAKAARESVSLEVAQKIVARAQMLADIDAADDDD